MIICDRCGNKASFDTFVNGQKHDLCKSCYNKLDELHKTFNDIEGDFMKKTFTSIKHIDFE